MIDSCSQYCYNYHCLLPCLLVAGQDLRNQGFHTMEGLGWWTQVLPSIFHCLGKAYMYAHAHAHARIHLSYPMYSLPLIGHATPQKGESKTRVQLLGRLHLFSWVIADWSSCLTPLCKDGSYDGKFTGRGASSPQGKSLMDSLSGAIRQRPGLWLLGVPVNSGSHPTRLPRSKCDASSVFAATELKVTDGVQCLSIVQAVRL